MCDLQGTGGSHIPGRAGEPGQPGQPVGRGSLEPPIMSLADCRRGPRRKQWLPRTGLLDPREKAEKQATAYTLCGGRVKQRDIAN